jgi:hypothetical protein
LSDVCIHPIPALVIGVEAADRRPVEIGPKELTGALFNCEGSSSFSWQFATIRRTGVRGMDEVRRSVDEDGFPKYWTHIQNTGIC